MTLGVVIPSGLTEREAHARLLRQGPNELPRERGPGLILRISAQLVAPLQLLLLIAGVLSLVVTGDRPEGAAILAVVAINAVVGAVQERRADAAVEALRSLTAPTARVVRDGVTQSIPAAELVVDDRVELAAGDRVPADLVIVEAKGLAVDEQILTGESMPAEKAAAPGDAPERKLFAGTLVVRGHAGATVAATGASTAIGRIGGALGKAPASPLETDLRRVAQWMAAMAVVIGAVLVPIGYARASGHDALVDAVMVGVALAVAAIPEGLPAIVTSALALGGLRMAKRGAIVRRLPAVESLGATTVLCVDKTGTLTTGRLAVADVVALPDREAALWRAAGRCNDAVDGMGDPIDVALLDAVGARGAAGEQGQRVAEVPFDTARRSMVTVHDVNGVLLTSVKGAPEAVLGVCAGPDREQLLADVERLASRGLRVLAIADAPGADLTGLNWRPLGLVAFRDPLRPSAARAVSECRRSGIRVVMVTGDHAVTAQSVAREVGLEDGRVVTGAVLEGRTPDERGEMLAQASVIARVDPDVKLELVRAHRSRGQIVAMTGDGVNDAPALRQADVGVAVVGGEATDVAREAATVLVTDGDLGTIVAAVKEGRRIFANLRSTVAYLISGNLSEIIVVVGAFPVLASLATPFLPIQLLWINLMTDALPALALGVDRPPRWAPSRVPRAPGSGLLDRRRLVGFAGRALVIAGAVLASGWFASSRGWADPVIRSQLLLTLLLGHLLLAYASRAGGAALAPGWWRNWYLNAAVGGSAALQVLVFTSAPSRRLLHLAPLPAAGWLAALTAGFASFAVIEIGRAVRRARGPMAGTPRDVRP